MFEVITESLKFVPKRISEDTAIKLIESSNPWFSSDYHIYKEFRYDNGNWAESLAKNAELHTNKIIRMHQNWVKPDDVFVLLGDLCESELNGRDDFQEKLKETVQELNGIKILLKGNNDKMPNSYYYDCGFIFVFDKPFFSQKYRVVFSHEPYDICETKLESDWLNVHGHIHGSRNYWNMNWERHIDVYPEINGFKPMKLADLRKNYSAGLYSGKTTFHQQLK